MGRAWRSALLVTTAPAQRRPRAVYAESGGTWTQVGPDIDGEAADDKSGSRYRCPRTARAWRSAHRNDGTGSTPATCACTPRAAGRGPRWAQTSTARLRTTVRVLGIDVLGRHARGDRRLGNDGTGIDAGHVRVYAESGGTWTQVGSDIDGEAADDESRVLGIYVLGWDARGDRRYGNDGTGSTPATCACTLRAAGRGPRWVKTSTARLQTTSPGGRYRYPRTARGWR